MAGQAEAARTPGAKRAGAGEYVFDLAQVNHILGGPDYSTANGACVEGDRMIVALMRMPAGTGAEPHSHPNEQWIYILEGTFRARSATRTFEAGRLGALCPVQCRSYRRGDAGRRRGVLHRQGRIAQPARHQGGLRFDGRAYGPRGLHHSRDGCNMHVGWCHREHVYNRREPPKPKKAVISRRKS